ncbi:hypothetical protein ACQ3G6_02200 [Allorhizobium undicola]|uniref:hypothetical protein n=1 Tax=Allorhizobium undicola TaxID=78527 RepID=UPI003D357CBE
MATRAIFQWLAPASCIIPQIGIDLPGFDDSFFSTAESCMVSFHARRCKQKWREIEKEKAAQKRSLEKRKYNGWTGKARSCVSHMPVSDLAAQ